MGSNVLPTRHTSSHHQSAMISTSTTQAHIMEDRQPNENRINKRAEAPPSLRSSAPVLPVRPFRGTGGNQKPFRGRGYGRGRGGLNRGFGSGPRVGPGYDRESRFPMGRQTKRGESERHSAHGPVANMVRNNVQNYTSSGTFTPPNLPPKPRLSIPTFVSRSQHDGDMPPPTPKPRFFDQSTESQVMTKRKPNANTSKLHTMTFGLNAVDASQLRGRLETLATEQPDRPQDVKRRKLDDGSAVTISSMPDEERQLHLDEERELDADNAGPETDQPIPSETMLPRVAPPPQTQNQTDSQIRIKSEPRDLSLPLSPLSSTPAPRRYQMTSGSHWAHPYPEDCLKHKNKSGWQEARLAWYEREADGLRKKGLTVARWFFRDDGMTIDWRSSRPVWSDTLLPVDAEGPSSGHSNTEIVTSATNTETTPMDVDSESTQPLVRTEMHADSNSSQTSSANTMTSSSSMASTSTSVARSNTKPSLKPKRRRPKPPPPDAQTTRILETGTGLDAQSAIDLTAGDDPAYNNDAIDASRDGRDRAGERERDMHLPPHTDTDIDMDHGTMEVDMDVETDSDMDVEREQSRQTITSTTTMTRRWSPSEPQSQPLVGADALTRSRSQSHQLLVDSGSEAQQVPADASTSTDRASFTRRHPPLPEPSSLPEAEGLSSQYEETETQPKTQTSSQIPQSTQGNDSSTSTSTDTGTVLNSTPVQTETHSGWTTIPEPRSSPVPEADLGAERVPGDYDWTELFGESDVDMDQLVEGAGKRSRKGKEKVTGHRQGDTQNSGSTSMVLTQMFASEVPSPSKVLRYGINMSDVEREQSWHEQRREQGSSSSVPTQTDSVSSTSATASTPGALVPSMDVAIISSSSAITNHSIEIPPSLAQSAKETIYVPHFERGRRERTTSAQSNHSSASTSANVSRQPSISRPSSAFGQKALGLNVPSSSTGSGSGTASVSAKTPSASTSTQASGLSQLASRLRQQASSKSPFQALQSFQTVNPGGQIAGQGSGDSQTGGSSSRSTSSVQPSSSASTARKSLPSSASPVPSRQSRPQRLPTPPGSSEEQEPDTEQDRRNRQKDLSSSTKKLPYLDLETPQAISFTSLSRGKYTSQSPRDPKDISKAKSKAKVGKSRSGPSTSSSSPNPIAKSKTKTKTKSQTKAYHRILNANSSLSGFESDGDRVDELEEGEDGVIIIGDIESSGDEIEVELPQDQGYGDAHANDTRKDDTGQEKGAADSDAVTEDGRPPRDSGQDSGRASEAASRIPQSNPIFERQRLKMERLALEFLKQFVLSFDSDRSALGSAYTEGATFSCSVHQLHPLAGSDLSTSAARRFAAGILDAPMPIQGPSKIARALQSLGSHEFFPRDATLDLDYDLLYLGDTFTASSSYPLSTFSHSQNSSNDPAILLTAHSQLVIPFPGDPSLDQRVSVDQTFLLTKRENKVTKRTGTLTLTKDGQDWCGWPLEAMAHQMVVRDVPWLPASKVKKVMPWLHDVMGDE